MNRRLSAVFLTTVGIVLILFMAAPSFAAMVTSARCGNPRFFQLAESLHCRQRAGSEQEVLTPGRIIEEPADSWE